MTALLPRLALAALAVASTGLWSSSDEAMRLGISGTHFTVDGKPRFPIHVSDFDALDTPQVERDFAYLASRVDGVRIFATWWDFGSGRCPLRFSPGTVIGVDASGKAIVRPDRLARLQFVLDSARAHRLVVDLSFAADTVEGMSSLKAGPDGGVCKPSGSATRVNWPEYGSAIASVARALKSPRYSRAFFDLQNEWGHPVNGATEADLAGVVRAVRAADPGRILTISSFEPDSEKHAGSIERMGLSALNFHDFPRGRGWGSRTATQVEGFRRSLAARGVTVPIYDGEPDLSGYGKGLEEFETSLTGARRSRRGCLDVSHPRRAPARETRAGGRPGRRRAPVPRRGAPRRIPRDPSGPPGGKLGPRFRHHFASITTRGRGSPMVRTKLGQYAAALVALALALAVAASADAQTGSVKGKVLDADGNPVEGATVSIAQKGTKLERTVKTNKKGEFVQLGVFPGNYTISAVKDEGKVQIDTPVGTGDNPEMTLRLGRAGPSPEAKAKAEALQKAFDAGVAASKAGKYDDAIASFNEAVGMAPNCADCYYNIGVANVQKQDLAAAEVAYKKALEVKPDHCDALANLASVYNAEKKLDLALETTTKAGQCGGGAAGAAAGGGGGGSAASLYNEGVILWNQGKYPEAKAKFEASAKADPNNAETQYRLGMANVNLGDMAGATAAFEACSKAAPSGPHAAEVKSFIAAMKK